MRIRTKGMGERGEVLDEFGSILRKRKSMVEAARDLRKPLTIAERLLWEVLRKKIGGCKFYRQAPIDRFVVDFYCPRKKLVIEVDGGINERAESQESDTLREKFLCKKGLRILRIRNEEIFHDLFEVWRRILQACGQKTHIPPPHRQSLPPTSPL